MIQLELWEEEYKNGKPVRYYTGYLIQTSYPPADLHLTTNNVTQKYIEWYETANFLVPTI